MNSNIKNFLYDLRYFLEKAYFGTSGADDMEIKTVDKTLYIPAEVAHAKLTTKSSKKFVLPNPFRAKKAQEDFFMIKVDMPYLRGAQLEDHIYTKLERNLSQNHKELQMQYFSPRDVISPYSPYNIENYNNLRSRAEGLNPVANSTRTSPSSSRSSSPVDGGVLSVIRDMKAELQKTRTTPEPSPSNTPKK